MVWIKKNRMMLLKIAAVVLFFVFMVYNVFDHSVLPRFESLGNRINFVLGIVVVMLWLYLFSWLYKWVVREDLRGWHVQSILIVLCGLGARILMDSLYTSAHPIGEPGSIRTILYYCYVMWGFLMVIILLLFFVFDRRKLCVCKTLAQRGISVVLLVVVACLATLIIATIHMNTPDDTLSEYGWFLTLSRLTEQIQGYIVLWGMALYFLLWLNTKPSEKAHLKPLQK